MMREGNHLERSLSSPLDGKKQKIKEFVVPNTTTESLVDPERPRQRTNEKLLRKLLLLKTQLKQSRYA